MSDFICPHCGYKCADLHKGMCEDCHDDRSAQEELIKGMNDGACRWGQPCQCDSECETKGCRLKREDRPRKMNLAEQLDAIINWLERDR